MGHLGPQDKPRAEDAYGHHTRTWVEDERAKDPEFAKMMDEESERLAVEYGDQPQAEAPEPNLDVCPSCGGPADNGNDRCIPPSPYNCSKCQPQSEALGKCRCGGEARETHAYLAHVMCTRCNNQVASNDPDTARDMWQRVNQDSPLERVMELPKKYPSLVVSVATNNSGDAIVTVSPYGATTGKTINEACLDALNQMEEHFAPKSAAAKALESLEVGS